MMQNIFLYNWWERWKKFSISILLFSIHLYLKNIYNGCYKPPSHIAFPYPRIVRLVEFIFQYMYRACFYFNSSLFIIPVCDSLLELEFVDRCIFRVMLRARWNNFGYQGPYDWNVLHDRFYLCIHPLFTFHPPLCRHPVHLQCAPLTPDLTIAPLVRFIFASPLYALLPK